MKRLQNNPKMIVVHHTGGTNADPLADTSHHTFEDVNRWHMQKWNYQNSLGHFIGYHWFISKEGETTLGTPENEEGIHTKGKNFESIGIGLAGNFDRPGSIPTYEQKQALKELLVRLMAKYHIGTDSIYPHRQFANKTCYGKNLSEGWARELVGYKYTKKDLIKKVVLLNKILKLIKQLVRLKNLLRKRK